MTKYRNSNAPSSTSTYNRNKIESPTENIYEAISIIAKRSNQINLDIRKELHEKLDEFELGLTETNLITAKQNGSDEKKVVRWKK